MYKNIIFDCFGTLIDTGSGSIDAVRKILRNIDLNIDEKEFYSEWKSIKKKLIFEGPFYNEKDLFRISLKKMFDKYSIEADAEKEVKPMIDILFGIRYVFPDTIGMLRSLDDLGIQYAIGSTTDTDSLMHFLNFNNLSFSNIFTSEDLKIYKPAPAFYTSIIEKMQWEISETLFVGDSITDDVAGPQSIGMKAVLIDRKADYNMSFHIKPDYVISALNELIKILKCE